MIRQRGAVTVTKVIVRILSQWRAWQRKPHSGTVYSCGTGRASNGKLRLTGGWGATTGSGVDGISNASLLTGCILDVPFNCDDT